MTDFDEADERAAAQAVAAIQAAPRPATVPYVAPLPYTGQTVDPGAQALVWALTASEHAAEALTAMAALEDMAAREATGREIIRHDDKVRQRRLADYHSTAHAIASKTADTWALVNSATLTEWNADESGEDGKTHADA